MISKVDEYECIKTFFTPRCKSYESFIMRSRLTGSEYLMTKYNLKMMNVPKKIMVERLIFLIENYRLFRCDAVFFDRTITTIDLVTPEFLGERLKAFYVVEPLPLITLADFAQLHPLDKEFFEHRLPNVLNTLCALHSVKFPYLNLSPFTIVVDEKLWLRPPSVNPYASPNSLFSPPPRDKQEGFRNIYEMRWYRAPEWNAVPPFWQSDLWSLAAVLVEYMITNTPLFRGYVKRYQQLRTQELLGQAPKYLNWAPMEEYRPINLPHVFKKMLRYDPRIRPPMCIALAMEIMAFVCGEEEIIENDVDPLRRPEVLPTTELSYSTSYMYPYDDEYDEYNTQSVEQRSPLHYSSTYSSLKQSSSSNLRYSSPIASKQRKSLVNNDPSRLQKSDGPGLESNKIYNHRSGNINLPQERETTFQSKNNRDLSAPGSKSSKKSVQILDKPSQKTVIQSEKYEKHANTLAVGSEKVGDPHKSERYIKEMYDESSKSTLKPLSRPSYDSGAKPEPSHVSRAHSEHNRKFSSNVSAQKFVSVPVECFTIAKEISGNENVEERARVSHSISHKNSKAASALNSLRDDDNSKKDYSTNQVSQKKSHISSNIDNNDNLMEASDMISKRIIDDREQFDDNSTKQKSRTRSESSKKNNMYQGHSDKNDYFNIRKRPRKKNDTTKKSNELTKKEKARDKFVKNKRLKENESKRKYRINYGSYSSDTESEASTDSDSDNMRNYSMTNRNKSMYNKRSKSAVKSATNEKQTRIDISVPLSKSGVVGINSSSPPQRPSKLIKSPPQTKNASYSNSYPYSDYYDFYKNYSDYTPPFIESIDAVNKPHQITSSNEIPIQKLPEPIKIKHYNEYISHSQRHYPSRNTDYQHLQEQVMQQSRSNLKTQINKDSKLVDTLSADGSYSYVPSSYGYSCSSEIIELAEKVKRIEMNFKSSQANITNILSKTHVIDEDSLDESSFQDLHERIHILKHQCDRIDAELLSTYINGTLDAARDMALRNGFALDSISTDS